MPTIAEAIAEGAQILRASCIDEERRTAGVLLGHALGADRAYLLTRSNEPVEQSRYQAFLDFINRRAAGEPLQYITGHQEFYGLDFIVTPDVLIPRPETEFLVEKLIALARELSLNADQSPPRATGPLIVDVGTGSGCIAVTIAAHVPQARVIAIDISRAAVDVARLNAERHKVTDRIDFIEGDLLNPLADRKLEQAVDFLASNPPYVPSSVAGALQREVRDWEPARALFGGSEGLDFYRRLFDEGQSYVRRGGHLVCEIGFGQLDALRGMIDPTKWETVEVVEDLQSIPRVLILRKA